jgi:1-acyl-sn-glycerol-3-phosphate acyltransferase
MPTYVVLLKYHSSGMKAIHDDPETLHRVHDTFARWEAKVLDSFRMFGDYDQMIVIEAPDNFKAYQATLSQDIGTTAQTEILPTIDQDLFTKLISQGAGTVGPHPWQTQWWAKVARLGFRNHAYGQWVYPYCKPLVVTGREIFRQIKGPCIVVANHTSHMDALVLHTALPQRIRWNIYSGAAADRWFVKGRKELVMQPWYQSLAMGTFQIQRGGGSKALDYPKTLLDKGCNLIIFPEGTRSTSRSMAKFRHGVSLLALEKQVPVVPVFLTGLKKLRPKGSRELHPGPAAAHILDPIYFAPGTEVPDATRQIYDALNTVHHRVGQYGDEAADPNWHPPDEADLAERGGQPAG